LPVKGKKKTSPHKIKIHGKSMVFLLKEADTERRRRSIEPKSKNTFFYGFPIYGQP